MHDRLHPDSTTGVLIVEDDQVLRDLISRVLETEGYRVAAASDGEAALLAFDDEGPIELLVADWQIPGMTGVELAAELRRRQPGLPVLLVTGSPGAAAYEQRLTGADDEIDRRVGRKVAGRAVLTLV